jgi:hypothetical protein
MTKSNATDTGYVDFGNFQRRRDDFRPITVTAVGSSGLLKIELPLVPSPDEGGTGELGGFVVGSWTASGDLWKSETPARRIKQEVNASTQESEERIVSLMSARCADTLSEFLDSISAPSDPDIEDPFVEFLLDQISQRGQLAVVGFRLLARQTAEEPTKLVRLVRAIGHVHQSPFARDAIEIAAEALSSPDLRVRDAAVSAIGLGTLPEVGAEILRRAVQREPSPTLKSAMEQTAEQLVQWGRLRATSQDRAGKMD